MEHPYDRLTPDLVVDCVEKLGKLSDLRLIALNSYENRVYQVGIDDGEPVIAKFYRPERWSADQIREEHAFTQQLADAGLSVVAPLAVDGETLHHHAGFLFAIFPRRGGYPPELDNPDHLLQLGRTLGMIHTVGGARRFEGRPTLPDVSLIPQAREELVDRWIPADLKEAYVSLSEDCEQAVGAALTTLEPSDLQRIHGDCHGGNILWRADTPHFVDFDDCVTGPVIQDLWMFLSGDDRHEQELQLSELLEGYSEFGDFPLRQLRWVEALRTLRIIRHALWLARRWDDPAFPRAFPWFAQGRFWGDHILQLREQFAALQQQPLRAL